MIIITALMTNGGAPYNGFTPTISIWNVNTGTQVVTSATMTQISTSAIYKYPFTTFSYGVPYSYLITGDGAVSTNERYQWGSVMQEVPDRVIGLVQSDAGNSAIQFKTDRTEATTGYWTNALCLFLTGVLAGQVQKVTGYTGSATYIVNFTTGFTGTPSNGDTYELINF